METLHWWGFDDAGNHDATQETSHFNAMHGVADASGIEQ
jgi:hypothetical protein